MTTKTIAVVTGANKGLGRETVRRLARGGWEVFLAARDQVRGARAVDELAREGVQAHFLALDVTSEESVVAAAAAVRNRAGRVDVLINNAAVGGSALPPAATGVDDVREVFETNVFGPIRVVRAFLPLLRASGHPRIVMVSSGMGSIPTVTDPRWQDHLRPTLGYPTTKAALNMLTTMYALALRDIRINAVDPGYTATDLNDHTGPQNLTEGTDAIVELASIGPDGPTGAFFDRNGKVSW
ncbi:SDR family NAD(P)-dependent oxidoreductase [Nocardia sp. NPDC003963]